MSNCKSNGAQGKMVDQPAVRNAFLPVDHLQQIIRQRNQQKLGWPTCVLQVKTAYEYRPDIPGTLSLFSNQSGKSQVSINKRDVLIDDSSFFLTNPGQDYSLGIDQQQTETFNVHFGAQLLRETVSTVTHSLDELLDQQAYAGNTLNFFNRIYSKPTGLKHYLTSIEQASDTPNLDNNLQELLVFLLMHNREIGQQANNLPATKKATRQELFYRLGLAEDYMRSHPDKTISLDELAGAAMLSKYHFLRLFKAIYKQTPHQFLIQIRLERAMNLLRSTRLTVGEIAREVGFEHQGSFNRLFANRLQMQPLAYRAASGSF